MLLNEILDDNDIQGHSSHKGDNVQLSPKQNSEIEDKDNSNR